MDVLIAEPMAATDAFLEELRRRYPSANLILWGENPEAAARARVLVAFNLPDNMKVLPPGIKAIFCFGAGVGHIIADPRVGPDIAVARMLDTGQANQMLDYALHAVLARLLDDQHSLNLQKAHRWERPLVPRPHKSELTVAVLGQGHIGEHISDGLQQAGFDVRRWTRTRRDGAASAISYGPETLTEVCRGADVVISVLPPAAGTENILCMDLFLAMRPGAYIVNLGRGSHVRDADLLSALNSRHLGAAWLDVFRQEPLPENDLYWRHPQVRVTPHRSGLPTINGAAKSLAAFLAALSDGSPIPGLIRGRREQSPL